MRRLLALGLFAALVCGCGSGGADDQPTWARDVAPLVIDHCSACHRPAGAAFPLVTYDEVRARADAIVPALQTRFMPPWPPADDGDCPRFVDDRRLPQRDIDLVASWVAGGMPEGDDSVAVHLPPPLGTLDDVALEVGSNEPYRPPANEDKYRCFIADATLNADAFITAYRVSAGPGVHHVQLWQANDAASEETLAAADDASPGPGFDCSDWPSVSMKYLTVWGPGDPVRRHPAGTGIRVRATRKFVLQVHYHFSSAPDQTSIGLELADHVEEEATMLSMANVLFMLPPHAEKTTVHAQLTLAQGKRLWGIRPHMHSLGSEVHIRQQGAAGSQCLISIPKWDVAWQLMYFYRSPIDLAQGTEIDLDCSYDTSSRDTEVFEGPTANNEMCFGYFYVTAPRPQ